MRKKTMEWSKIENCRVCNHKEIEPIHDFGIVPLADKLTETIDEVVPSANLSVGFCTQCDHLQVLENVSPEILFKHDYPYFSSQIPEVVAHFIKYYQVISKQYFIEEGDLVLEIASNDGVLLKHFKSQTSNVLGVEPSFAPANRAEAMEIPTIKHFFNKERAKDVLNNHGVHPRLIMANNVLAHVPDPQDFVSGLKTLTGDHTVIIIEVPHRLPMIKDGMFDVIFHQHYSYFSLHSLQYLFEDQGLFINQVESVETQGGSLRLHIQNKPINQDNSVKRVLDEESEFGLADLDTYIDFSNKIDILKDELYHMLFKLKNEGARIVGYGAPGKAATLLNYFHIDHKILSYLVDVSNTKHNKIFPFTGLKIHDISYLEEEFPDYILILAWNYAESIMKNLAYLKERKVKFITIYPRVKIV